MVQTTGNSSESTPVHAEKQSSIESNDSSEPPQSSNSNVAGDNLKYLDFEVEIRSGKRHQYPVVVLNSPGGEAAVTMNWPYTHASLESHLTQIDDILLRASTGQNRRTDRRKRTDPSGKTIQEFGTNLFDALISGEIRNLYDVSREKAFQQGYGLRIKLRINEPKLATLPWEYMYDQRNDRYLGLSNRTPIVRYLEAPQSLRPLITSKPLRILGMAANPKDGTPINSSREKKRVETALQHLISSGLIELKWVDGSTWRDLQRELFQGPWHIFHFIGHGYFDEAQDQGYVVLNDDNGNGDRLSAKRLGHLLADHHPLRLVLLNACDGARASIRNTLSSTASILVKQGIPAVLAMQNEISNRAAVECARSFYQSIAYGRPVDAAAADARKGVSLEDRKSPEWGTPVLYMRSPDGLLLQTPKFTSPVPNSLIKYEGLQRTTPKANGINEKALATHRQLIQTITKNSTSLVKRVSMNDSLHRGVSLALPNAPKATSFWRPLSLEAAYTSIGERFRSYTISLRYLLTVLISLALFGTMNWLLGYFVNSGNPEQTVIQGRQAIYGANIIASHVLQAPLAWTIVGFLLLFLMRTVLSITGTRIAAAPLVWAGTWLIVSLLYLPAPKTFFAVYTSHANDMLCMALGLAVAAVSQSHGYSFVANIFTRHRWLQRIFPPLLVFAGAWFALSQIAPAFTQIMRDALLRPLSPLPNASFYKTTEIILSTETEYILDALPWASVWACSLVIAYVTLNAYWTVTHPLAPLLLTLLTIVASLAVGVGGLHPDPIVAISFPTIVTIFLVGVLSGWIWLFEKRALYRQLSAIHREDAKRALSLLVERGILCVDEVGTQLKGSTLRGLELTDLTLDKIDLSQACLVDADLTRSRLRGCDLRSANLHRTKLAECDLSNADLRHANLGGADVTNLTVEHALYDAKTVWPKGYDYRCSGAIGPGAICKQASLQSRDFSMMDLEKVNFMEADLAYAKFTNANLAKANFRGANLVGADLSAVSYKNATFRKALYDDSTRWPEGFNPEKRGAIAVL